MLTFSAYSIVCLSAVHPFTSGKDDPFRATALCSLCNTQFRMRVISYVAGHRARSHRPVLMRVVSQNDWRKFQFKVWSPKKAHAPSGVWGSKIILAQSTTVSPSHIEDKKWTCEDPWVKSRCWAFVLANLTDLAEELAAWPQIYRVFIRVFFSFLTDLSVWEIWGRSESGGLQWID